MQGKLVQGAGQSNTVLTDPGKLDGLLRACLWAGPFFIGLQSAGSVAEKRTKRTTISEWVDNETTFVIRFPRQVRDSYLLRRVRYDEE